MLIRAPIAMMKPHQPRIVLRLPDVLCGQAHDSQIGAWKCHGLAHNPPLAPDRAMRAGLPPAHLRDGRGYYHCRPSQHHRRTGPEDAGKAVAQQQRLGQGNSQGGPLGGKHHCMRES